MARIVEMHANSQKEVEEVRAGDIVAFVGLKDVTTGDTPLCDENNIITLERMEFPILLVFIGSGTKTKADQEKMSIRLTVWQRRPFIPCSPMKNLVRLSSWYG